MTDPSGGNTDAWLAAIDPFGNVQWAREFDGGGADRALALAWTTDAGLALTGLRAAGSLQRALVARTDRFGHASCAASGTCQGKAMAACADGQACTADDCHPAAGCQALPVDAFACDPQDGCSLDGQCQSGACKPGAVGRLYQKTQALAGVAGRLQRLPKTGVASARQMGCRQLGLGPPTAQPR